MIILRKFFFFFFTARTPVSISLRQSSVSVGCDLMFKGKGFLLTVSFEKKKAIEKNNTSWLHIILNVFVKKSQTINPDGWAH